VTWTRRDGLRYLSHLLSAPIIATPVFVVLALIESGSILSTILSLVFATVVPIVGIVGLARIEGLDYDIPERTARARPFIVAILSYLTGFIALVMIKAPVLVSGLMLAYFINTSAMFLITFYWKISVHAAGVTGPFSFLVFRLGPAWGLIYLLMIPVGLIRLKLGEHTVLQVLAGAVLSAALTWVEIIILIPEIPL
jgi:membrane-associated phospholipid phosphatase